MPALAASVARVSVDIEAMPRVWPRKGRIQRARATRAFRRVAAAYGVAYMAGFRPSHPFPRRKQRGASQVKLRL